MVEHVNAHIERKFYKSPHVIRRFVGYAHTTENEPAALDSAYVRISHVGIISHIARKINIRK